MSLHELIVITVFIFWTALRIDRLTKRIEWLENKLSQARGEQWWVK